MNYMGAIPVDTSKGSSLVKQILAQFKMREVLHLAIAPEGTRKPMTKWKGGFYVIARAANVPVYYAVFDWGRKEVGIVDKIELTDDFKSDMLRVKQWYKERGVKGKHPEKFILGDDLD
jgi:1-acyl-sn-glycerol-3-phosphate acyltransferase